MKRYAQKNKAKCLATTSGPVSQMGEVERFEIRNFDPKLKESERDRVLKNLARLLPFATTILEVGSTAVQGIVGKEDIDLLVRVPRGQFSDARQILDRTYSRNERQFSDDEFQSYLVISPLEVAVHLVVQDERHDVFERFLHSCGQMRTFVALTTI
jgi:GrpB-like predicted nucleotidyltransferase (UPF0157 family)